MRRVMLWGFIWFIVGLLGVLTLVFQLFVRYKSRGLYNVRTGEPMFIRNPLDFYRRILLSALKIMPVRGIIDIDVENANIFPAMGGDWLGPIFHVSVADQQLILELHTSKAFDKNVSGSVMKNPLASHSLFFAHGEHGRRMRKVLDPCFKGSKLRTFIPLFNDGVLRLLQEWEGPISRGEIIVVDDWFQRLTFDLIGIIGFGHDFKSIAEVTQEKIDFDRATDAMTDPFVFLFGPWFRNLPLKRNYEGKKAIDATNKLIQDVIEDRMKKGHGDVAHDILDAILQADENHELTPLEIQHNIYLFFLAGRDTSSSALTSCMYYLARYPQYQQDAFEEVNRVFGDSLPAIAGFSQLKIIPAIIQEVLRMKPPANGGGLRVAVEDTILGDYNIPKGTYLRFRPAYGHYSTKIWEHPEEFDPYRFLRVGEKKGKMLSFSYGPRICIGAKFAKLEMTCVLAMILQRYVISIPQEFVWVSKSISITTAPIGGLPVKFTPRT